MTPPRAPGCLCPACTAGPAPAPNPASVIGKALAAHRPSSADVLQALRAAGFDVVPKADLERLEALQIETIETARQNVADGKQIIGMLKRLEVAGKP